MATPQAQHASLHRWRGLAPAIGFGAVLIVSSAALVLAGGGWVIFNAPDRSWIREAVSNRMFILCGLVTLGCIVVMSIVGGMLWRAGAAFRRKKRDQDGNILLEFTLALPFLLFLALLMTQSSLLMGGNLCVHYAAYCSARSAIVQIPANLTAAGELHNTYVEGGMKFQKVKAAAVWALWPVSCGSTDYPGSTDVSALAGGVQQFFAGYGVQAQAIPVGMSKRLAYAAEYTTVTINPPADGKKYADHEDIHVNLAHTLYLSVPFAGKLFANLSSDGEPLGFGMGEYGMKIYAKCTLTNEGIQDYIDAETLPQ